MDLYGDPDHCGTCGNACPEVPHAFRGCERGWCGRGPCQGDRVDLDGLIENGCEGSCTQTSCTFEDGSLVALSAPPVSQVGAVFQTSSAGGAYGSLLMKNSTHTHVGIAGEPTAAPVGASTQTGGGYINHPGFNAVLQQRMK